MTVKRILSCPAIVLLGFNFASRLTLEFRGTYFEDFTAACPSTSCPRSR